MTQSGPSTGNCVPSTRRPENGRPTEVARRHRLSTHMDGARLMNAVVASGVSAQEWAAPFDSAWIDFTKGLGAPVGAALAGSREFIDEAWRCKQQMGGAMRQAGIIAAGGVYALRHNVKRLAEDHTNARRLAEGLAGLPGVRLDPTTIETNIVFFELTGELTAPMAVEPGYRERGVDSARRTEGNAAGSGPSNNRSRSRCCQARLRSDDDDEKDRHRCHRRGAPRLRE